MTQKHADEIVVASATTQTARKVFHVNLQDRPCVV